MKREQIIDEYCRAAAALYNLKSYHASFLLVLCVVDATAKKRFPEEGSSARRFKDYLRENMLQLCGGGVKEYHVAVDRPTDISELPTDANGVPDLSLVGDDFHQKSGQPRMVLLEGVIYHAFRCALSHEADLREVEILPPRGNALRLQVDTKVRVSADIIPRLLDIVQNAPENRLATEDVSSTNSEAQGTKNPKRTDEDDPPVGPRRRTPMNRFTNTSTEYGIACITINRPDVHNAFNEVVIEELTAAFRDVGGRDDVRAVVLASEGKSFSAGADINWMRRMVDYSIEENVADANAMADMLRAIRECPKPTIARVQGATFGGGVGLVAACDMAVAVKSAIFCLSEVKLGIVPAVISPYVTEKIGPGAMRRYGVTAERFDAVEAKRIGLISEVVDSPEELDAWIADVCKSIKASGPQAVAACKRILSEVAGADWDRLQAITTQRIAELRVSPQGQEGLNAFLEKRKPNWCA